MVNGLDLPFRERVVIQVFDKEDGVAVVDGLDVLTQGLAADGEAFKDDLGFLEGVAFDGVGVVGPAEDEVFVEVGGDFWREGAVGVEELFEGGEVGEVRHYFLSLGVWLERQ